MKQRYCNGMVHVIKNGDNLYQLSRKYRVPLALILRANPYVDVYNLQEGQEICIPISRRPPGMGPVMPRDGVDRVPDMANEMPGERMPESEENKEQIMEEKSVEEMTQDEGKNVYVSDGTKSLGDILKENRISLSEFLKENDLGQIIIAADVVLYMPKNV